MKRLAIAFIFAVTFVLFLSHTACDKHPVFIPVPLPTPTPTSTPIQVNITISGSAFNPAAVTITAGSNVIFTNLDGYPHTVQPDDGFGTCGANQFVQPTGNVGDAVTFQFSTAPVTINYHCWFHSACFGPPCDATCGGAGLMTGTIVVQ